MSERSPEVQYEGDPHLCYSPNPISGIRSALSYRANAPEHEQEEAADEADPGPPVPIVGLRVGGV